MIVLISVILLVIIIYFVLNIKNSLDDEDTKLFRRIWACNRNNNQYNIEKEVEAINKLFKKYKIDFWQEKKIDEHAILYLLLAAHKFDKKYPHKIIMIDLIHNSLISNSISSLSPSKEMHRLTVLEAIKVAPELIALDNAYSMMGETFNFNAFSLKIWNEQTEVIEKTAWKEQNSSMTEAELATSYHIKMMKEED